MFYLFSRQTISKSNKSVHFIHYSRFLQDCGEGGGGRKKKKKKKKRPLEFWKLWWVLVCCKKKKKKWWKPNILRNMDLLMYWGCAFNRLYLRSQYRAHDLRGCWFVISVTFIDAFGKQITEEKKLSVCRNLSR